jgi:hypothetical protein
MDYVAGQGQAAARKRKSNGSTPTTAIVPVAGAMVALGTLQAATPGALVQGATAIAQTLSKVIQDQKLFNIIQGKRHVRVEGWTTLGALLGVLPREVSVTEEWGVYTATVELVRMSDGAVLSRASAECGDEAPWCDRPRYSRRSMAITRATGKVCRLAFSWIMALAGYEACPSEEMEGTVPTVQTVPTVPTVAPAQDRLSPQQLAELRGLISQCSTEEKFCKYLKIQSLMELPASRFDAACAALRQEIGKIARGQRARVAP